MASFFVILFLFAGKLNPFWDHFKYPGDYPVHRQDLMNVIKDQLLIGLPVAVLPGITMRPLWPVLIDSSMADITSVYFFRIGASVLLNEL